MTSTTSTSTDPLPSIDDLAIKAVTKRYEGLVTVRTRAIKGKGAWYWAHLEPILVRSPDSGLPKSVKLKCSLCRSLFSASNPSRTASEHLKGGACPNLSSLSLSPLPISSVVAPPKKKKRTTSPHVVGPTPPPNHYHPSNKASVLTKEQIHSALELLADWFYDSSSSGVVSSFSALDHPKFQAFLAQVGFPAAIATTLRREISGSRLDSKYDELRAESEARIRDAVFFQLASDGWKKNGKKKNIPGEESFVRFSVNLPNGTSVLQKVLLLPLLEVSSSSSSEYAEEVLWEAVRGITSGSVVQRCVGIVADRYKAKALRNLEFRNHWMVNIYCQIQGFISLIKDFNNDLPLFRDVTENCLKVASYINNESHVRTMFLKYRTMPELDEYSAGLLRVPHSPQKCHSNNNNALKDFSCVFPMLEDVLSCARVIQMVVLEKEGDKEVSGIVQSGSFWNELEAVYSLVNIIRETVQEIEAERPLLIGRCLPLWEEMRTKVKDWCAKHNIIEETVEKILEERFRKNYHPAWSTAFVLDPLYLIKDTSGKKYLPPFKLLTREQEKDVDKLLTRLAPREDAHVVLMELMKWRSEGLDPLYAQAVQMKERDPVTGRMKVANPLSNRLVWETCLSEFKTLGRIAVRLIFLHATSSSSSSCGFKSSGSNWTFMRRSRGFENKHLARDGLERAQKMMYVAAHAKLERRERNFCNEEEKDAELFSMTGSEDGMLDVDDDDDEVFAEAVPLV